MAHSVVTASPGFSDVMQRRYRIARPGVVLNVPEGRLVAHAERVGAGERIELVPPGEPTEVVGALSHADVGLALFVAVCRNHELLAPNKMFEYMAAGLPVLVSDVPVMRSFVEEHGFARSAAAPMSWASSPKTPR